jgi:hypothetical protein
VVRRVANDPRRHSLGYKCRVWAGTTRQATALMMPETPPVEDAEAKSVQIYQVEPQGIGHENDYKSVFPWSGPAARVESHRGN